MAPLRNNRRSNRSGRTQVDHDIMEGLPVRQWRVQPSAINTAPPKETTVTNNGIQDRWTELAMPKGSELYSPMAQALLRAARKGQVNRPPSLPIDDEREDEEDADGDLDTGFVTMRWTQVPKDQDRPEPEFLAKRRKGLPLFPDEAASLGGKSVSMRKVRVRKVDASGNVSVFDVLAPEGTAVEGEIADGEEVVTEAPAPGTVVEGVGIVNAEGVVVATEQVAPTPQRRRPPPPKRKAKGPGRGRKKKSAAAAAAAASANALASTVAAPTDASGAAVSGDSLAVPGSQVQASSNGDTEMGDDSVMHDGDEGSEDDDDESEKGDKEDGEILENEPSSKQASPLPPKSSAPLPSPLRSQVETQQQDNAADGASLAAKPLSPQEATKPTLEPILKQEQESDAPSAAAAPASDQHAEKHLSPRKEGRPIPAPLVPKPPAFSKISGGRDPSTSPDVPLASATFSPTSLKDGKGMMEKESDAGSTPLRSPIAAAALKSPTRKRSIPNRRGSHKASQPTPPLPQAEKIPSDSTADVSMTDAPMPSAAESATLSSSSAAAGDPSSIASVLDPAPETETAAAPLAPIIAAAELAHPAPMHVDPPMVPPTPMVEENRPDAPPPPAVSASSGVQSPSPSSAAAAATGSSSLPGLPALSSLPADLPQPILSSPLAPLSTNTTSPPPPPTTTIATTSSTSDISTALSPPPTGTGTGAGDITPVTVQDPAQAKLASPVIEASIPPKHNPLEGLVAPKAPGEEGGGGELEVGKGEEAAAAPESDSKSGSGSGSGPLEGVADVVADLKAEEAKKAGSDVDVDVDMDGNGNGNGNGAPSAAEK